MGILMWIGIVLLFIFIICVIVVAAFSFYVSSPSMYNATAYNSKVSNQYYRQDGKVVFVRNGNFFQIGGKEIEGADSDTFEVIDQSYAKDINNVYFNGKSVVGASPSSVKFVKSELNANSANSGYLISNDKVFCYGDVIEGAEPTTFVYLHGLYSMDKDYLYYYIDIKIPLKLTPAAISNANEHYIRHKEQVIYQGQVISNEANSFKIISDEYSTDTFHIYSYGEIVEEMVPDGFTIISPYYRKDKNQAYYFNTPILKSDPNTFKVLNDTISKDQRNLYYRGNVVENKKPSEVSRSDADELEKMWKWDSLHLDATTVILVPSDDIEKITNDFYVYNNEVYGRNKKLENVKPEDVIVLDLSESAFVRISNQVFYHGTAMNGADPESFTIISDRFSKDANHVYWREHRLVDTEPSTFKYDDNLYADENEAGEYCLKVAEY
ncbi:DKNYY domain-containing protein [Marinomonas spartinae]|uniref:DKNYY domain-containing protein n=1 Tax=Marinomonas spartinae TaxID=1792290 RepID=UPI0018F174D0|nr:DKNYY domain-containing protein [Marinomonas spartinae]MBJ7554738.1 DKNYY domain-containing protein [Marinomonas spartinae]